MDFNCPKCKTRIVTKQGTSQCTDCGYAPPHGAD